MEARTQLALEIAKDITVSKMSNSTLSATQENGEKVAAFFEAIFNKVLELTDDTQK